jgi:hypothetical protein
VGLLDYDQHLYAQSNGLAYIKQSDKQERSEFNPYTDKAIGWHTDGYYKLGSLQYYSVHC